jgi:flotillin
MPALGLSLIPILLFLTAIAVLVVVMTAVRNYIKVPPNKVAVFYGRRHRTAEGSTVGFRLVTGGAALKWPILESVSYLDLTIFPIDLDVRDVPNKDGVLVSVQAVANVKVRSDETSLSAAAERFLGRSPEDIKQIAYKNLEGHLRSIVGRLTVEEIVRDRAKFNQEVLTEAAADLAKIGLGVDVLTIQRVADPEGYIEALGKKRTAEVKRDAQIGEAAAAREATIQSTTALREAKERENENIALVAQAEKERDVRKAQYEAQVLSQQAQARQAGPLAEAKARQAVVQEEVQVEFVRTVKSTEVAAAEAARREKALLAEVVRPAEAQKQQTILIAEASKQREILEAEGHKTAVITIADAEKQRLALEGSGAADATRAKLLAEAEGAKAKLLAEAEGALKKAQAFASMEEPARSLLVLERLPEVIRAFAPVAGAVAAPMGNIDKVVLVDTGSADQPTLSRYASTVPATLYQTLQAAHALGLDLSGLLGRLGAATPGEGKPSPPAEGSPVAGEGGGRKA